MNSDVLIVGAGVAGLMTAIELADAGLNIQVFESGQVGMESSWAGGGILSPIYPWRYPDPVNLLVRWSNQHYPQYLAELKQQTGIDPEWLGSGHLILQTDVDAPEVKDWLNKFPHKTQQLDQQQLHDNEPALADSFSRALWLPEIGQLRNPRFVQALRAMALRKSITIHEHTSVEQVLHQQGQVTGLQTRSDSITAGMVVVTAGAWSGQFHLEGIRPEVHPVKGQMIQFQTEPGSIRRISLYEGRYVIPRKDGKVLVGSTLEHSGFNKSVDEHTRNELHEVAATIYPSLKDAPIINHWAGLRPGNERQTPFIGQHPAIRNLYFNTGHYRNGIVTGLASARLCADLATGKTPALPAEPYALG